MSRFPAYLLVPLLLAVVAARQAFLVVTSGLSPWKGGGFGMFATVDQPDARVILVEAVDLRGDRHHVRVPFGRYARTGPLSTSFASHLRAYPTRKRLLSLALAIADSDLSQPPLATERTTAVRPASLLDLVSPVASPHSWPLREVIVSVHRIDFDRQTMTIERRPVGDAVSVRVASAR